MTTRKKYSKEFKLDAISLVLEQGYRIKEYHNEEGQAFRGLLKTHGRQGDCGNNAVVESFFGVLKQERVQWRNCQTRYEAWQAILNYIAMFYHPQRLHSYLGYKSPSQHEAEMSQLQKVA